MMKTVRIQYMDHMAVWIGLLIGLISFLVCFGISRALGTNPVYRWPAGDQAQHIAGAFAYLDGNWSFPIFFTDRINYPAGVNIIFTDSAPFAGLIAKLLHSLTGVRFNYLGSWFCVLWIGQAAGGAYLMRQLAPGRPLLHISGAIFALTWPAFLNRHFHLALSSHFLLLFALGLYFQQTRSPHRRTQVISWSLILAVAVWTHVYLFLMAFAICCAAAADAVVRKQATPRQSISIVATGLLVSIGLALIGGYQTVGDIDAIGYGSFRLDLAAYVWPHGSALLPAPLIWDLSVAFEGYNYLGLGGLAIVLAAVITNARGCVKLLASRPWLVLCVTGMFLFAVTNYVTIGSYKLFEFPLPTSSFPFSTFRASGRFGWILGYLAVFGGLATVYRRAAQKWKLAAAIGLCAVTALQVADTRLLLRGVELSWFAPARPIARAQIAASTFVSFVPPIGCIENPEIQQEATELLAIVAQEGKRANSAHVARTAAVDCSLARQTPAAGELQIVAPQSVGDAAIGEQSSCTIIDKLSLCRRKP